MPHTQGPHITRLYRQPLRQIHWICAFAVACAPDLEASESGDDTLSETANFRHTPRSGGGVSSVVDATDYDVWVYLDFESRAQLDPNDRYTDARWDLGFKRFEIITNSGISGNAEVRTAALYDTDFDAVSHAPNVADWRIDRLGDKQDDDPFNFDDLAFADWYDYEPNTHVLTPRPIVYVVHTADDNYFKVKIDNYYTDAGTPATIAFRWAEIEGPQ